ncbi:MAG: C-GCAxxG-C-C family protein [Bacteroidales bacterium]|nr:C-GCAxxG-C-C family protein [Bacteroidales bacterium]
MDKTVEKSKAYFNSGFGCAESVLKAVAEYKGIESILIPRIATGFCGGVANTDGMCGAILGGVMALNIIYGRDKPEEDKSINYQKVQQFIKDFESKFGSTSCPGLTDCDLSSEEGRQQFSDKNLHQKCAGFTGEATRMVLELMK